MKRMWSKNELRKVIQETYGIDINNLIDKDGHERFIDFDGVNAEITGITFSYSKASLSGSHLLIVVAGSVADSTAITGNPTLVTFSLPKWIHDKIFALYSDVIDVSAILLRNSTGSTQNATARLIKASSNQVKVGVLNFTATDDRTFRIAFDLLIDND